MAFKWVDKSRNVPEMMGCILGHSKTLNKRTKEATRTQIKWYQENKI